MWLYWRQRIFKEIINGKRVRRVVPNPTGLHPYKKERICEDTAAISKPGRKYRQQLTFLPGTLILDFQPLNCEEINFCCLSHSDCSLLCDSSSWYICYSKSSEYIYGPEIMSASRNHWCEHNYLPVKKIAQKKMFSQVFIQGEIFLMIFWFEFHIYIH